jgi:hypothetical protein
MPDTASHPHREANAVRALRRQSHAPERAPAGVAEPLTPSQARTLRLQARASGADLTPSQERAVRHAFLQHPRRPPPRCDIAAVAAHERSSAQRAAMQDRVLQEMQAVDFAADSARPQLAPIAHVDRNVGSRSGQAGRNLSWPPHAMPVRVCLSADAAAMPDSTNSMKGSAAIEKARCGGACLIVRDRHGIGVATLMLRDVEAAQLGKRVVAISPLGEKTPMEDACILSMEDHESAVRFRDMLVSQGCPRFTNVNI